MRTDVLQAALRGLGSGVLGLALVFGLAGLLTPAVGALAQNGQTEPAVTVTMTNQLDYDPKTVTIQVGETILWKNTSLLVHTVTADPAKAIKPDENVRLPEGAETFKSGDMDHGDTFRHTFTVPGKYVYFCVPHEADGMIGEVIVEE